jgi:hypothetical protein
MYASRWCLIPPVTLGAALLSAMASAAEPAVTDDGAARANDDRRAAAVLATLGEQAGELKTVSGWSTVIVGVAFTTTGILVDNRYDASYGPAFWLGGVALIANGLTSLLIRPPIETFADEVGSSPAGLEATWRARAAEAKSRRETIGIVELGVGATGAIAATIFAAGVGDLSREDRSQWVTLMAVAGGAGFASGLYRLLVESDIENGYAVAYPETTAAARTVDVGVAPLPNGGGVQLQGTF